MGLTRARDDPLEQDPTGRPLFDNKGYRATCKEVEAKQSPSAQARLYPQGTASGLTAFDEFNGVPGGLV